jgi:glycosyltransferase involved in cell wall biosynthesis
MLMRVCHIWQNFFPIEFGGAERYVLSLSDFLHKHDSINFKLITDRAAFVPFSRSFQISSYQRIRNLEVHRLGPNFFSFLRSGFYRLARRTPKSLDDLLAISLYSEAVNIRGIKETDVFHIHGFWQPLYPVIGLRLSQRFHRPFVVTLHGDSVSLDDPFSMPIRAPTTLAVLRHADVITTFSKETFKVLEELDLDKRSRLIPNFIDSRLFKRPSSDRNSSGSKIVMISRLSKPKDPMTPIRAFSRVKKEIPEATFKIVGYGPLYEDANRLVHDLNLQEAVTFFGMKSDVRKFLWDNDIFIATRGSYITTLEAWAAGVPVVAPKFGIMKELISEGENGLLATPGDTDQLASDLIRLIRSPHLRTNLVAKGKEAAEKHDIQNVAPLIANVYKSLL